MIIITSPVNHTIHKDGSSIRMISFRIVELCLAKLKWVEEESNKDLTNLISSTRKIMVNRFWHKFLNKPSPTDQEVLNYINYPVGDGPNISETDWTEIRYSKIKNICYKLLNAAKYADEIVVSTEDLMFII